MNKTTFGIIVGVAVGAVVLVILGIAGYFLHRKRQRNAAQKGPKSPDAGHRNAAYKTDTLPWVKVETATEADNNGDQSLDYSFMYQPKTLEGDNNEPEQKTDACVDEKSITIHVDKNSAENPQKNNARTSNFVENWIRTSPTTCDPVEIDVGVDNPGLNTDEQQNNVSEDEVPEKKISTTSVNNLPSPQRFYFGNSVFSPHDVNTESAVAVDTNAHDNSSDQAKSSPATSRDSSTNLEDDESSYDSTEQNFPDRKSKFHSLPTPDGDIAVSISDRRHSLPPNDSAYGSNTPSDCYETHSLQYRSSIDSKQGRPTEFTAFSKMEDLTQIQSKKQNNMDDISCESKSSKSESVAKFRSIKLNDHTDSGRDEESYNDASDASSSEEESIEFFNIPGRSQSVTNLGASTPIDKETRLKSISSDNIIDTASPSLKRTQGMFSVADGAEEDSGALGNELDIGGATDEEDSSFVNEIMDTLRMDADWNSMFGQWKLTSRSRSFHAPRTTPNNSRSKRSASTVDIPKKVETI